MGLFIRVYGNNSQKAKDSLAEGRRKANKEFFAKYPYANVNKFKVFVELNNNATYKSYYINFM